MGVTYNTLDFNDFMKAFFPKSQARKSNTNAFREVPEFATESSMYTWIVNTLNGSGLFTHHTFSATPYKADPHNSKVAVDCGMYRTIIRPQDNKGNEDRKETHNRRSNWSRVEIPIQCKMDQTLYDPFDDGDEEAPQPNSYDRRTTLGQILSYAELVFEYQQRTCQYMVLFLSHMARILRFDRSGIYVTKKFDYKSKGELLTEFLQRYGRLGDVDRGFDTTAKRIEPSSALGQRMVAFGQRKAKEQPDDYVQQLFNDSLNPSWPWWKLEVHVETPDPHRPGRTTVDIKTFLVGMPHFETLEVVSRGTRGYVAVAFNEEKDELGELSYLKDAWRVKYAGTEQEGSVLRQLNEKDIPFVPTLVCHGDLPGQVTVSQKVWEERWLEEHEGQHMPDNPLQAHYHYRLVVKEVGKSLSEFKSGLELVKAFYCIIYAHAQAYKLLGIMHRDISAGNILLYKKLDGRWYGMLTDWELSTNVDSDSPFLRQPDGTGTRQFMSARALNDPHRKITIEDELESCFHALLYYAVRFLPHNIPPQNVGVFLSDYFDGYTNTARGPRCGGAKMFTMRLGRIDLAPYSDSREYSLHFFFDRPRENANEEPNHSRRIHPINTLLTELLAKLTAYYNLDTAPVARADYVGGITDAQRSCIMNAVKAANHPINGNTFSRSSTWKTTPEDQSTISEANARQAASLATHNSTLALFKRCMMHGGAWPLDDKRPEPSKGPKPRPAPAPAPPAPDTPSSSAPPPGKRPRDDDEVSLPKRTRRRLSGGRADTLRDVPMTRTRSRVRPVQTPTRQGVDDGMEKPEEPPSTRTRAVGARGKSGNRLARAGAGQEPDVPLALRRSKRTHKNTARK